MILNYVLRCSQVKKIHNNINDRNFNDSYQFRAWEQWIYTEIYRGSRGMVLNLFKLNVF